MSKRSILFSFFYLCSIYVIGQSPDLVLLKEGGRVEGKILSIDDSGLTLEREINGKWEKLSLPKNQIREIIYGSDVENAENVETSSDIENASSYRIVEDYTDSIQYNPDPNESNQALKFNISAYQLGSLGGSYEYGINTTSSLELVVAAHGWGLNPSDIIEKRGIGMEFGYKKKMFGLVNMLHDYGHTLQGTYLKAVVGFGSVNEREEVYSPQSIQFTNANRNYGYLGFDLGSQWVFGNLLSFDLYTGLLYYNGDFEEYRNNNGAQFFNDSNSFEDGDIFANNNVAVKIGFRVGILFGKHGIKPKF